MNFGGFTMVLVWVLKPVILQLGVQRGASIGAMANALKPIAWYNLSMWLLKEKKNLWVVHMI